MIISPAVISEGHKGARMNGTLSSTESLYVNLVLYTATIASDFSLEEFSSSQCETGGK